MRLATFNIKNGWARDGSPPDVRRLAAACASLRADVLALQEVDRWRRRSGRVDQAATVGKACGLEHVYAPTRRFWLWGGYGNALLADGRITAVEVVKLPVEPGREARNAIVAQVDLPGTQLSVAATHLQNRRGVAPTVAEDAGEQLAELDVVLEAIRRRPRPRVVLGDLNVEPPVARPALEGAGFVVGESAPTIPAAEPVRCLDYVAVDGLDLGGTEVVVTPVSDHRAVVAEVTSPKAERPG